MGMGVLFCFLVWVLVVVLGGLGFSGFSFIWFVGGFSCLVG